jgi:hypothetical protein
LIDGLLEFAPEKRLGIKGGFQELKSHPYFEEIDFNLL